MAKARYTVTTKGSTTHVRRIGPPGDFPIAQRIPFGGNGGGPEAAPRTTGSRGRRSKKDPKAGD